MEALPECTMVLEGAVLEELEQTLIKVQGVSEHRVQLLELPYTTLAGRAVAVALQELQITEVQAQEVLVVEEMEEFLVQQAQTVLVAVAEAVQEVMVMWVKMGEMV
jgi:hypothetical protein